MTITCSVCQVSRPTTQYRPSVLRSSCTNKRCKSCLAKAERKEREALGVKPRVFLMHTEMGQECGRCRVLKCFEDFAPSQVSARGAWCRDCRLSYYNGRQTEYGYSYTSKNRTRDRNRLWFEQLKARSCCTQCGENHPAVLDWHHHDPTEKDSTLAYGVASARPIEWLEAEAAKCIVLCANCHRKLHFGQKHAAITSRADAA